MAVEGEVVESHADEESESFVDAFKNSFGDDFFLLVQFKGAEEFEGFADGHARYIKDIFLVHEDRAGFGSESRAFACAAGMCSHELADFVAL